MIKYSLILFLIEFVFTQPQLLRRQFYSLYDSEECKSDIKQYCDYNSRNTQLTDFTILQCFHNQVKDLNELDFKCQNLVYEIKRNFTRNLQLDSNALKICKEELDKLPECKNTDLSKSIHLSSCLVDNLVNITSKQCKNFVKSIAALIFSDYRFIDNFQEKCDSDIKRHNCGRLSESDKFPTSQGKTIECLASKIKQLEKECRKQMFRIAELQSEDFHLDRVLYFACKDDREKFCGLEQSGNGRVYECLIKNKFNAEMSQQCQEQLTKRQQLMVQNIQTDKTLIVSCEKNIIMYNCRKELATKNVETIRLSSVLLCLEDAQNKGLAIDSQCRTEMIEHRRMLMQDYKLSPDLVTSCSNEINFFCNNGIERNGKTLHCLFKQVKQSVRNFSSECVLEIKKLIRVVDAGEDIRVDTYLTQACSSVIRGVCKDVIPGEGRVLQCLLQHIGTTDMNDECEEKLLDVQFFVNRDWKLTPRIFKACGEDAKKLCFSKDSLWDEQSEPEEAGVVLSCLYTKSLRNEISKSCNDEITQVMQLRAKRIDLMPEIQEKCYRDLEKFCIEERDIRGQELYCLQKNLNDLSNECKKQIITYTENESKDVRLDQILMRSCSPIIQEFCQEDKDEKQDLIDCLIKQKNNPKINIKCKAGIEHHQLVNLKSIRFNPRFNAVCEKDLKNFCHDLNTKIDAINCLSDHVLNDTLLDRTQRISITCRQQLRFEYLQLNENIDLDPGLELACRRDRQRFCNDVKSGNAQVIECLKSKNSRDLSKICRTKLHQRDALNLREQSADYRLQEKCKNEIKKFCPIDEDTDFITCLRKNLLEPQMQVTCRVVVINRIINQNKDIRLNPTLWKACKSDSYKYCRLEFVNIEKTGEELNGRVVNCLKKQFVKNMLTQQCSVELEEIMREAANIDYRMDPLLVQACDTELNEFCGDFQNEKKEDCLKLSLQQNKITKSSNCFNEVKRLISEGAADVFTDHELMELCAQDINRLCYEIPPGAANQLKCLLNAQELKNKKLSQRCSDGLTRRKELWNLAEISSDLSGIKDIYYAINKSNNKFYIFSIFIVILFVVFMLGCTLRPTVKTARWQKLK